MEQGQHLPTPPENSIIIPSPLLEVLRAGHIIKCLPEPKFTRLLFPLDLGELSLHVSYGAKLTKMSAS